MSKYRNVVRTHNGGDAHIQYSEVWLDGLVDAFRDIDARLSALEDASQAHAMTITEHGDKLAAAPEQLKPGWYWVKWKHGDHWRFGHLSADTKWRTTSSVGWCDDPTIIGPRIDPPKDGA